MSQPAEHDREGFAWQRGIRDRYPEIYRREVDQRFAPVVEQVIRRAALAPGQRVLDLGTGTGSVALRAAPMIAPDGVVLGVDLSSETLAVAQQRAAALGLTNVQFREGRAEVIPAEDGVFDVVLASLSLMYAIDRTAAGSCQPSGLAASSVTSSGFSTPPADLPRPRQFRALAPGPSQTPRRF
jgi:SAM-dependent methyltransferase